MRSIVTSKNRVSIPAELSRRFGISPGCRLEWVPFEATENELIVRIIPKRADLAQRLLGAGASWAPKHDAVEELRAERSREG